MNRLPFKNGVRSMLVILMLSAVLLSACGPSIPQAQVEQELVPFMLDFIVQQNLGGKAPYAQSGGHLWAEAPQDAALIVWAPPVKSSEQNGTLFVNTDEPTRVWWFADNQLAEVTDKVQAIQAFRQAHFSGDAPEHGWGYYEFGILSVSADGRLAKVYLGISCGPLCGTGTIYTLQRNEAGTWSIKDSEGKWIS